MSAPAHHLPEEMLLEYAAGSCTEGEALMVAVHCTLCPQCRARVEVLEAVGDALWDELDDAPLAANAEARMLAALDEEPAPRSAPPTDPDGLLPAPLVELVGPSDALPWRFLGPGIRAIDLPVAHGELAVQLVRLSPRLRVPKHEHRGLERTLILSGGLSDNVGEYGRGDVLVYGEDFLHERIRIDPGEPCIALSVNDHPFLPRSFLGKLFRAVTGF